MFDTSGYRIGVDLGGTKIELLMLDPLGREQWRRRVATPQGDYGATLAAIRRLVDDAESALGLRASVGVGTPGAPSPLNGRMRNCNSTWLNGERLQDDLEAVLARPVHIANDANCFALSEAIDGAAAGARCVFGVILGTGVGGGIVVHGQPLSGCNAIAGEWGHNPLPWPQDEERPGPACYCGRHGCIETWLSGPGFAADHVRHGGLEREAHAIARRAAQGSVDCLVSLERYCERLARALAHVINLLDPEVIVLGGGLSNIEALYTEVPRYWKRWVFSDIVRTRLLPPKHGDSSGVRGAAWLWAP
ncbi:ROK family protein [Plasticicumulans acidivorans]|uniref:N-acetylglucosamine kinase n=1 Tax=Plasticicumulans acidivorans TaxID=886464 RepID=A0A317MXY4_9GAMM|nr:ROK family protein [Plasticicumulans acidivorans]PWV64404.1 N-acetylglucosamine kinase [Plasticicumulans acidivorans]